MIKVLAIWDSDPNLFSIRLKDYPNRNGICEVLINPRNVVYIEKVNEHEQHQRGYTAIIHTIKPGALYVQEGNEVLEKLVEVKKTNQDGNDL